MIKLHRQTSSSFSTKGNQKRNERLKNQQVDIIQTLGVDLEHNIAPVKEVKNATLKARKSINDCFKHMKLEKSLEKSN